MTPQAQFRCPHLSCKIRHLSKPADPNGCEIHPIVASNQCPVRDLSALNRDGDGDRLYARRRLRSEMKKYRAEVFRPWHLAIKHSIAGEIVVHPEIFMMPERGRFSLIRTERLAALQYLRRKVLPNWPSLVPKRRDIHRLCRRESFGPAKLPARREMQSHLISSRKSLGSR